MATQAFARKRNLFVWEGTNRRGEVVNGEITAISVGYVKAQLRHQGITPKKVRKKFKSFFRSGAKRIKTKDITFFSRQMATMLTAGIPLVQAFDIVARGTTNTSLRNLILDIKSNVEAGSTFSEALKKHPRHFNELYQSLVHAGEQSGSLDIILSKVATYKEKTESLKGKIKKALFYPASVVIVAFVVTAAMLIFVVPQFQQLFQNFGAELPAMTRGIIHLSDFFQRYWWLVFGSIGFGIYTLIEARKRNPKVAHACDRTLLQIPIIGQILEKAAIARFSRTLAITFAAGLPLVDALKSVAGATGNILFANATHQIRESVATGQQMQVAMRNTNRFPNMVVQMVAIGEESGALEQMLTKVADFHEEEVDNAVESLSSLLEPAIMVFLGVIVGGLVVAMYLPIFKLGSVI